MHSLDITASSAIVACLLLMVLVEVGSRQLIVAARYLRLHNQAAPAHPAPLAPLAEDR